MKKGGIILAAFALVIGLGFIGEKVELLSLVGQSVKSEDAKAFIKESGKYTKFKGIDNYYYMFNSLGFDLMMSKKDTIASVFVYSEGADGHSAYAGELPYGLKITMARYEVEKVLGVPDVKVGAGNTPYYCGWKEKGIDITYIKNDTEDMINLIHHISFSKKVPLSK